MRVESPSHRDCQHPIDGRPAHRDGIRVRCRGQPVPLVVTLISKGKKSSPPFRKARFGCSMQELQEALCWCLELIAAVDKM